MTAPDEVAEYLDALVVVDGVIAFNNEATARRAVEKFAIMNRDWWAGDGEAFIYNRFADALRAAFEVGALAREDLYGDDAHVLSCLHSARSPEIEKILDHIAHYKPERLVGFNPRVIPKNRWLDPPIARGGSSIPLSKIEA